MPPGAGTARHFRDTSFQRAKARVDGYEHDSNYDSGESDFELHDIADSSLLGGSSVDASLRPSRPASWRTMPHKTQLAILCLSRFADFFYMACLQAIMFYQLKSFDESLSDAEVARQAGILQGGFTAAQVVSAVLLGSMADKKWSGRKRVLLLGFVGTGISCVGVAFSGTFQGAVGWRIVAGAINGTAGTARTVLAETVDKRFHSRAFVLLPLAFNMGNFLGPLTGGVLAAPLIGLPSLFGSDSWFGGRDGVQWMKEYPYAAPNLLSALIMFIAATAIFFGLFETLESRRFSRDMGLETTAMVKRYLFGQKGRAIKYTQLKGAAIFEAERELGHKSKYSVTLMPKAALPFSQMWTRNVCFTMLSTAIFHFHLGAVTSLWPLFVSAARPKPNISPASQFHFGGGLAFPPLKVGLAMSIVGILGVTLQLFLYPPVSQRLGLLRSLRLSMPLFPLAYFFAPYLALVSPDAVFVLWSSISIVLLLQVAGQTFALPATIILLNNCSPHPSVLGSVHGIGQSVTALSRTLGSILAGSWFADGLKEGVVGRAWWTVAGVAALGLVTSWLVKDGSELALPGDDEDESARL